MLMVEMFELHNREQFEVYGYCWSPEDGSAMRQRVISAMDHFDRINGMNDAAAAQLIHSHEIDILFDPHGQTLGARPAILAAPTGTHTDYLPWYTCNYGFPLHRLRHRRPLPDS